MYVLYVLVYFTYQIERCVCVCVCVCKTVGNIVYTAEICLMLITNTAILV